MPIKKGSKPNAVHWIEVNASDWRAAIGNILAKYGTNIKNTIEAKDNKETHYLRGTMTGGNPVARMKTHRRSVQCLISTAYRDCLPDNKNDALTALAA